MLCLQHFYINGNYAQKYVFNNKFTGPANMTVWTQRIYIGPIQNPLHVSFRSFIL
jgi:hypothetical protein